MIFETTGRAGRGARSTRGGALVASLVLVMLIAGMGVAMVQLHAAQTRRQVQSVDDKRALYVAEAGLAEAFLAVSQGKSGKVASADLPAAFGNGVYWVEANDLESGQVSLRSTGLCGVGRSCLNIVLQRQSDPMASLGVFSHFDIVVGEGAIVDGYDSREGTFAEQIDAGLPGDTTGEGGRVGSNGDVLVEGEADGGLVRGLVSVVLDSDSAVTVVYGDAVPGPEGAVSAGSGALVTGSTAPSAATTTLPPIQVPTQGASPELDWRGGAQLATRQFLYEELRVPSGAKLELVGPLVLTVGELTVEDGAEIYCDTTGGQVEIHASEYLGLLAGARLTNTSADPRALSLLVSASEWSDRDGDGLPDAPLVFELEGDFYGYVYAPDAALTLPASTRFYGGAAAGSLAIEPGAHVSFDRALSESELSMPGMPKLVAWRIVELPRTELVSLRNDPLRKLERDGITPLPSGQAQAEGYVKVRYFDGGGALQTFTGEAKNFDWGLVSRVVETVWDDDSVVDGF